MNEQRSLTLTVRGAEKRDAGRGVARLPEAARKRLGVLSGDTVVVEGSRATVAKVWPGNCPPDEIRIDADTRSNAGVTIGDTVTVRQVAVSDADAVRVELPIELPDEDLRRLVARDLLDRPLRQGETVRLERLGVVATVSYTNPDGTVHVTDRTRVTVLDERGEREIRPGRAGPGSTSRSESQPERDTPESEAAGEESSEPAPTSRSTAEPGDYGVTYEDIGGLDEELELVREMIELPLSEPELFQQFGVEPPKGVLLHGPPGTGKTLIARAVANEVAAHFVVINGPEVVSKYKGDSEERLREKFEEATANQPAIIFIDEIDSIAGSRDEDADMENRLVAQLLTLLDGLESRGQVIVIGATNRVDSLDPALRRGGRFDREIEIGAPTADGRREILDVHTRGMALAEDVNLDALTARTHGFVGADLQSLAKEAGMNAIRHRNERETREVTTGDFELALGSVEPSAMREYVAEAPEATFADVGDLDEAKQALMEAVMWPLQYHRLFDVTRTEPPSGVLLYGPPGTGKTLLARALAGESEVNFIHVNGPEVLDRYVGESEKAVRKVFDRARQAAPSIVFLDEIDAIAGRRGEGHEVTERVVSQLLTEMDGLESNPNVMVLAATNRRQVLDPALLRPGRLESHVEVPLPDEAARRAILNVHAADKPLAEDVSIESLAAETGDCSGAELEALVREASMRAIREFAREVGPAEANERAEEVSVDAEHFAAARKAVERSKVD
jgi:transitional endoplasmic reticulum ATPase